MQQHARTWEESPNIAKWRRKQGVNRQYTGDFDAIFFITSYWLNPYLYSGFSLARARPAVPLGLWFITLSLRANLYVPRLHMFIKWFADNDVTHRN